ncbi:probable ATP-dependent RNA helicase spindle-E [Athalia rosae]|uniref:probable ATP-dependent RNA helicase spindle-E n=1 Tax=Athalia rosae TaxID=37344 RepID=UPI00203467DD|nr:probable ATP-dependent RNA helicase spindle-E [Athalia rosae]
MEFFDLGKHFERVAIPGGASRMFRKYESDSDDDESVYSIATGTDYVTKYVKEENKSFIEMVAQGRTIGGDYGSSVCDLVSHGTIPNIHDVNKEKLTKVYKTFNFAYRPKATLTITSMKDHIVSMIETNQCVVIQGPTGCGKTTQVPQFILNACFDKKIHCNIVVTQPRRIAAISIAKRVSEERHWPVGTLVGYQIGMVNNTSEDTRLTYCTTGVLLEKLINTKHMMEFTHIILDEVHERDQNMDFLLLVVRKLSRLNSHPVKIILMSATYNIEKFASYFSVPIGNKLEPAPVIDVTKKNYFNVNIFYLDQLSQLSPLPEVSIDEPTITPKMTRLCLNLIIVLDSIDSQELKNKNLEQNTNRSVILIFLPGIFEIEEMYNILKAPENDGHCWDVLVMHSSVTNEEQQRVFQLPPVGFRRIILSTNIAESSITVPDVKYVIDFCLTKQLVTDPTTNFQCLELTWASKASCKQRAGRTGRVMDGRVYRLIPEEFYRTVLPEESNPEMLRAPLESLVLKAKLLDMGEPKAILALSLDPPDLSNLERTILLLKEVGGLVDLPENSYNKKYDGHLTDLGRIMARIPADIRVAKLFILGHVFSVLKESIIIGASMSVKSMFNTPFREKSEAYNAKLTWADSSCSDCIAFLNAYNVWIGEKMRGRFRTNVDEKNWAQSHFIQIRVLREVHVMVQEIGRKLSKMNINETVGDKRVMYSNMEKPLVIKFLIAGAFYPNYFVRRLSGGKADEREAVKLVGGNDPANSVYLQGWPTQQPGVLYARQFQKIFRNCSSSHVSKTLVSFDGSNRVYIQFNNQQDIIEKQRQPRMPGKISLAVYKALKMRQDHIPIVVRLLDPASALKKATELGLPTVNVTSFALNVESKDKFKGKSALSPVLPSLDVSYIPIFITSVEDPGCFWARILDDKTTDAMKKINDLILSIQLKRIDTTEKVPINSLVIAPLEESGRVNRHRATVSSLYPVEQDILVQILYIDFGITRRISLRDLCMVDQNSGLYEIPCQAFKCVLANVQPSALHSLDGQWSDEARQKFQKLLFGPIKLFGEIYSVVQNVVAIKLHRVDDKNEKIIINEFLINNGFAQFREENYLSRCNNELRAQQAGMDFKQRYYHEQQQYDNSKRQEYPHDLTESHYSNTVRLKGPYSPLEMELVNLVSAGRTKKIIIEPNSVNSVLLDTDPADCHERLLVAGVVSQNVTGERLCLRNTTLMPNIYGLPSLIALIFAPTMELRRNELGSRYIGALCGLGYDPKTNKSLFPDHDMTVTFDTEITMSDLQEINKLRHWMNLGIHIELSEQSQSEIAFCQRKAKEVLLGIIGKKRKSQEIQTCMNFAKWNQNPSDLLLVPGKGGPPTSTIYKFHSALDLNILPSGYEEMCFHLQELRNIANGYVYEELLNPIDCKLCTLCIRDIAQLRMHLSRPEHKKKLEGFLISKPALAAQHIN